MCDCDRGKKHRGSETGAAEILGGNEPGRSHGGVSDTGNGSKGSYEKSGERSRDFQARCVSGADGKGRIGTKKIYKVLYCQEVWFQAVQNLFVIIKISIE